MAGTIEMLALRIFAFTNAFNKKHLRLIFFTQLPYDLDIRYWCHVSLETRRFPAAYLIMAHFKKLSWQDGL